ncbi:MAG: DUF2723 domain-containing protein [Bacteroidales bacterium]|nr:DUF2723 domain-containing protein [Bacteroidales bacterium]
MKISSFRFLNLILGWIAFLIAFITFYLTMEPTVSWWDAGEFIASATKLEVGHPPGAPLFMLIARVFASLAGEPTQIAKMVNLVSVLASAFTVMFLYWTIVHLARKMAGWNKDYSLTEKIFILGSGMVGALVFTFSDSFWFSAVEGEVYALSSLFTAVVFWAILRWEAEAEKSSATRWILLIAYLTGLSIGVHLLNLLAIPAMIFIYYFKKYKPTPKGIFYTFSLSVFLVLVIMYGIIPGLVLMASWFELFFINLLGLPFNTGVILFIVLLIGFTALGIYVTHKRGKVLWNTVLLAFTMIVIGYSSYSILVIRSNANTPMEQNNPDEVFRMIKYLNRDQYGDRPLLFGQYYTAPVLYGEPGKPTYTRVDDKYEITDHRQVPVFDKRFLTIFPRMWHNSAQHAQSYKEWALIKGKPIQVEGQDGELKRVIKPTFTENLRFFFSYQLGHMYFRYFMWNFVGRQDDIQSHGGILHGNWLSGIGFVDDARLGSQEMIPDSALNHKSRNVYYFLPLLLGIIGAVYQYRKGKKDFWVIMLLFVYTGIAIVVYLNQWPNQPRERDYAFAGSYYAFAIWIGLGILGLMGIGRRRKGGQNNGHRRGSVTVAMITILAGLCIPALMASQNWDDHDRSNRYMARDFAYNYLNSCAPNAILFTNGDNDTFPLWYAQEVEGVRTDVRVICLPYLAADWYIEQMYRKVYDSDPIPFSLAKHQYRMGTRDYIPVFKRIEERRDILEIIEFVASDDERTKVPLRDGTSIDYLPTNKVRMLVDSAQVMRTGTVQPEDADKIVSVIEWDLKSGGIGKNDLMILDLIAHNNWERPIYFTSIMHQNINGLQNYFQLDGLAYRFVPINTESSGGRASHINTDLLYDRFMNEFSWGQMDNPDTWVDYYTQRTVMILRIRYNHTLLAEALLAEGKITKAVEVLDRVVQIMPKEQFPYEIFAAGIAETYYKCEEVEKANVLINSYLQDVYQDLAYYIDLQTSAGSMLGDEAQRAASILSEIDRLTRKYGQIEIAESIQSRINELLGNGS